MGGIRLKMDLSKMKSTITKIDTEGDFRNWSEMQAAVANSEYGREVGISAPNVYNFINKHKLEIKTPRAKRGDGLKRLRSSTNTVKTTRGEKFKNDEKAQESIKATRRDIKFLCGSKAPRYFNILNKLENGSMKAGVAVACLQCMAGDAKEVRDCDIIGCGLHLFRPWKKENNDDELGEIIIDDVESNIDEPVQ